MISMKSNTWMDVKGVVKAVRQAQVKPLFRAGLLVERSAKDSMEGGGRKVGIMKTVTLKGGKRVKRPRQGTRFEPSAPGDPPHVRTGVLRASIATSPTKSETVVVGPTSPPASYGQHLEFGTRKMAARPFMRPALMRVKTAFASLWKSLKLAATPAGRKLNRRKT